MTSGWLRYGDGVPAEARRVAEWAVPYLGLGDWRIWISMANAPNESTEYAGSCDTERRNGVARIELQWGYAEQGGDLLAVLLHELLHVVFAPLDMARDRTLDVVKKGLRDHVHHLYVDGLEQVITRLTAVLRASVPATEVEA